MGAHWNLIATTKIMVEMDKSELDKFSNGTLLPDPYSHFFEETKRVEWGQKNSLIGDREQVKIEYSLLNKYKSKIKNFLNKAYDILAQSNIQEAEYLSKFMEGDFSSMEFLNRSENEIKESLQILDDNYYLRYECIPDIVVYSGWPDELKDKSKMYYLEGYVFISSYFKIGEDPEGEVEYEIAKRELVKALTGEYEIANFIYNLKY